MTANHWSNCNESEVRSDSWGHRYCACCGCLIHHEHPAQDVELDAHTSDPGGWQAPGSDRKPQGGPDA